MFNMREKKEFMDAFDEMLAAKHHFIHHRTYEIESYQELNVDVMAYLNNHPDKIGSVILVKATEWEVPLDLLDGGHHVMVASIDGYIFNLSQTGVSLMYGPRSSKSSLIKGMSRPALNRRILEAFLEKRTFKDFFS